MIVAVDACLLHNNRYTQVDNSRLPAELQYSYIIVSASSDIRTGWLDAHVDWLIVVRDADGRYVDVRRIDVRRIDVRRIAVRRIAVRVAVRSGVIITIAITAMPVFVPIRVVIAVSIVVRRIAVRRIAVRRIAVRRIAVRYVAVRHIIMHIVFGVGAADESQLHVARRCARASRIGYPDRPRNRSRTGRHRRYIQCPHVDAIIDVHQTGAGNPNAAVDRTSRSTIIGANRIPLVIGTINIVQLRGVDPNAA